MIRVFQPSDTTFTSNGDVVFRPLRAKVRKEDNFYLDIEHLTQAAPFGAVILLRGLHNAEILQTHGVPAEGEQVVHAYKLWGRFQLHNGLAK